MSTSDQQGQGPLTRKQLREIRLTGSTPVITPEEAAAAAAPPVPPLPRAAEPVEIAPAPTPEPPASDESDAGNGAVPLTRRQVRERERVTTESVPVAAEEAPAEEAPVEEAPVEEAPAEEAPVEEAPVEEAPVEEAPAVTPLPTLPEAPALVTAVPAFTPPVPADESVPADDLDEDTDAEAAEEIDLPTPVSASGVVDHDETTIEPQTAAVDSGADERESEPLETADAAEAVAALGIEVEPHDDDAVETDDVLADVQDSDDQDVAEGERPTVNPAFGQELLSDPAEAKKPFVPSFDELLTVGDSTGSQHLAPNTLIFTPSAGDGSLSGPVASTGEILVTGSYELPKGLGSQGHAHGTTDGKDVDAVLIDGELAPASSPTPIAASSAVSTIKPAGEIIRPPAPEKGNKLMLILAIVAGGLALALGVALIVAFTTNVF
ncbi:hypothetical protein [Microbacterium sp.]|uniref:hypothetical protein n=1 Tax=Microbacterium sp. TaxID=51671 RepID=UPI003564A88C